MDDAVTHPQPLRTAAVCAFSITSRVTQRDGGTARGDAGKPHLAAPRRPGTHWRAPPRRSGGLTACRSGHRQAEAVRPDQPHAVPAAGRQQVGAGGIVQPGGDHHARAHAPLAALLRGVDNGRRGHGDHRQVHVPGQVGRRGQSGHAADLTGMRVDRVHRPRVPGAADVVPDHPAHRPRPSAGADHRDRPGREHMPQAGHVRLALPFGHCVQVAVQVRAVDEAGQRDDQVDHPVGDLTVHRQAGVRDDLQHRRVLGQRQPGERGDPMAPGVPDQVLQQQRRDSPVVHPVGHRERDLGFLMVCALPVQRLVAGDADHLAALQCEQRRTAGPGQPADQPRLGLGRLPAEAEKAQVGVVRRHRLVHGLDRVVVAGPGRADLHRAPVDQQRVHAGLLSHAHPSLLVRRQSTRGRHHETPAKGLGP